jgi:hypothetical protein
VASFVEEHCRDTLVPDYERGITKCQVARVDLSRNMKGLDTIASPAA